MPLELRAPASELLRRPATWRIALEDPMALQGVVMAAAGLIVLLFLGTLVAGGANPGAKLLPLLIALGAFVSACVFFFVRRRGIILRAFERGFVTRAQVLETSWLYTQRPIRLVYRSGDMDTPATGWLAWGSRHRRLRREKVAWVVVDPARPGNAYFVEPLGVEIPPHLAALELQSAGKLPSAATERLG